MATFNPESPSREDWIRLAMAIDCEGCIVIWAGQRKGRQVNHYMEIRVANCDSRLTDWCLNVFTGTVYRQINAFPKRDVFQWKTGKKLAFEILKRCYPFLMLKREQADLALEFCSTVVPPEVKGKRRKLSQEVIDKRNDLKNRLHLLKRPQDVAVA